MEAAGRAEKSRNKTPTLRLSRAAQLPQCTNCLACSEDGSYLSLGHSHGLSLWSASSLICVAEWLQDKLEITSIQMTRMTGTTYLLGTIDDMGVARVFAYHCDKIHLLSVINIMENINKRSICLTFELSEGGHYGAASIMCSGAVWLEVYIFPLEAWLKELKEAGPQEQDSKSSEQMHVKWSPPSVTIKIRPPKIPAALDGPFLDDTPFDTLSLDTASSQTEVQPFNTDGGRNKETNERCCTHHFLLPCSHFLVDSKTKSHPELPVAVCVWWGGRHNLHQYFLRKTQIKTPANVDPKPDVWWPTSKKILCSAVTRCTRYVALGLDDALVCVRDRQTGFPSSVVSVSATDSAFVRMQFVDYWPVFTDSQTSTASQVHLLVVCKSGAIHKVITERGRQTSTLLLTERPKDSKDLPTVTAPVPLLQSLLLVVQRNGKMFVQDVVNKTTVCFLRPPSTHLIATPCNPVYALNAKQQTLFIRGDQVPMDSVSSNQDNQSQLFRFHFGKSDLFMQYHISLPDSPQHQKTLRFDTMEEMCNLYLQQRALSVDERNNAIRQTWKKLQETAEISHKRQSSSADN
ncbi:WD repeat-containing protein 93 isoform X2 [Mastacembelus armatus]|uniref:WD repeat-containing protein 93 isoform X2 n=1 Tax=Mastacembelus armatus TaxID=205130 RepID=UPI000E45E96E|nr:WD repeat-containing protein 93 isoform X2 [Mastacembelus armatus]